MLYRVILTMAIYNGNYYSAGVTTINFYFKHRIVSLLNMSLSQPELGMYLMLSSQDELVDNVEVHEPLGSSDHNQIHFI